MRAGIETRLELDRSPGDVPDTSAAIKTKLSLKPLSFNSKIGYAFEEPADLRTNERRLPIPQLPHDEGP